MAYPGARGVLVAVLVLAAALAPAPAFAGDHGDQRHVHPHGSAGAQGRGGQPSGRAPAEQDRSERDGDERDGDERDGDSEECEHRQPVVTSALGPAAPPPAVVSAPPPAPAPPAPVLAPPPSSLPVAHPGPAAAPPPRLPVVEVVGQLPEAASEAVAAPPPALVAVARPPNAGVQPGPEVAVAQPPEIARPDVILLPGPEGRRVAVTLATLPLLSAIWLWALVHAVAAGFAVRSATYRSAIAGQLGLRPAQLAALDAEGLRRLRDGIAFDELTGVLRRAAGLAALDRELARAARTGQPLSLVFVDVDGLKAVNDTRGHAAGDALLKGVCSVLTRRLRTQDLVFRYGGDEFVCVMPSTSPWRAEAIAAEMRDTAAVAGFEFSYGVAQAAPRESPRTLIARADTVQYVDKQRRRAGR